MKRFIAAAAFLSVLLSAFFASAQFGAINSDYKPWPANWVTVPNENPNAYGVYLFRRAISIDVKPKKYIVHVSADNRYKLFVNGWQVSAGPARSDLYYWNYETVDLAPYLNSGKNVVSAIVWNEADYRPQAQMSLRTGFMVKGDGEAEELNTGQRWRCLRDSSRTPLSGIGFDEVYYVCGPGETVDMSKQIRNWMDADFDDRRWFHALNIAPASPKGVEDAYGWELQESSLPQSERSLQRISVVRQATGVKLPPEFPAKKTEVTIAPHTDATILLDQTFLTNAIMSLELGGGKGGNVTLGYAEALYDYKGYRHIKGNRNDVEGKIFLGRRDSIICDGSATQSFTSLTFRTFRYIQIIVHTENEPLVIHDLYGTFTAYPFVRNAHLQTPNPEIQKMLDIGWRTARLCSFETYMDCPYYEQLQYIGDSRIQALISYYNSGDDRLARNALNEMDHSRLAEGITLSRNPSYTPQIICTFSLWYIAMLHDYWMYRNDPVFVKNKLHGVQEILHFFNRFQQADGSIRTLPYWAFVDWIDKKGWGDGMPPKDKTGCSAVLDMQLLMGYEMAAEMETKVGTPEFAAIYNKRAALLRATIQRKYWNAPKKMYSDNGDMQYFSQHVNSLAILTDMIKGPAAVDLSRKLESDTSLNEATIYFKYYVHQAMVKGGLGDDYINWLDQWRRDIKAGLTTWAETSDLVNTRSDCHAWAASPNIEFFRTLLGVDSDAPGFAKVKITPHLGTLVSASGNVPHPNGEIDVSYQLDGAKWHINIDLPEKTTGTLVWKGKTYPLKEGNNKLTI